MAKKITLYAMLAAICLVCGYIESLLSLSFIAPGIKLGLSNSIALLLVAKGDFKGAFSVNITRILLSALLFSTPFSLVFSLSGGIISLICVCLLYKTGKFSIIGISIAGGVIHNIVQLTVAYFLLGNAVLYYLPFLIISGGVSGAVIGFIARLVSSKTDKFLNI